MRETGWEYTYGVNEHSASRTGYVVFVMFKPRHYHADWGDSEPQGVMQVDNELRESVIRFRGKQPTMNETVLRLAHAEYERQHSGQDYERMQQRGGLSVLEVVRLLADHVERLGGKPSEPRKVAT